MKRTRKKQTKGKLIWYICLATISFLSVGVCFYLGIKFDFKGEKPYVIIPVVIGVIGFLLLALYALFKIYPYANAYDKKKLKRKTFKYMILPYGLEEVKTIFNSKFQFKNNIYQKTSKRSGLFREIKYSLFMSDTKDLEYITDTIKQNTRKSFSFDTKRDTKREVDIFFIITDNMPNDISEIEISLDEQYLDVIKDPYKVIIPVFFETSSKKLYYYEKWSKANITILKVATNFVKSLFN